MEKATKSIDIVIFRFDLKPLERALEAAVKRDVAVRALVAHTNTGGDKGLRQLELRLLKAGVTVARTNNDLVRYHGKLLVIDRAKLYILGFNYTAVDLASRSFGIQTKNPKVIRDVLGLIDADACRTEYATTAPELVISPENARAQLTRFLSKATHTLDIYDPNLCDDGMLGLLKRLAARGVRSAFSESWKRSGGATTSTPGRIPANGCTCARSCATAAAHSSAARACASWSSMSAVKSV